MESLAKATAIENEGVEGKILVVRSKRVMLDSDLAQLYGVTTKRLNEQVRRNPERFPSDFMFALSNQEVVHLKSQIATSSSTDRRHGGRRKLPLVFTEHGALMLASVLNSKRAIEASVQVVRAFVRLRAMLAAHVELAEKIKDLESRYDRQFSVVFRAIDQLMRDEAAPGRRPIGFEPPSG